MTESGHKQDNEKPRWDLLPLECLTPIVNVLTFGAQKYTDHGWQTVVKGRERYYAALLRHLEAYRRGEQADPESGLSHLAHAGCCLVFLIWFDLHHTGD